MTVQEYLKKINGVSEKQELVPDMIQLAGFVDVIPKIKGVTILAESNISFNVDTENLVTRRSFELDDGSALIEKRVPLNDDISLHCGEFNNPEELIRATITGLEELQESELRIAKVTGENLVDYQSRIDSFKQALECITQNEYNQSNGAFKK